MKKKLSIILVISWALLIFFLSNQTSDVSGSESKAIISSVIHVNNINYVDNILREMMHFIEYFIFGILLINCFNQYKIDKKITISIMISFIYIVSDEIHQIFVPGRAFEYLDIGLDLSGAILGIFIFNTICKKYVQNKKNNV